MHDHSGKSCNEVLFKCCDGPFCSVDSMVVWGDKLDVDVFRPDIFFDCSGTFIVHQPPFFGGVISSVNAVTMDASVQKGMAQMMIALRP